MGMERTAMTKLLTILAFLGAATSTIASTLLWTLLTEPTTIATALGTGDLRLLVTTVLEAWR
jgi:hypothetical protein